MLKPRETSWVAYAFALFAKGGPLGAPPITPRPPRHPGDVESGAIRSGSPAVDNRLWLKVTAALNRHPELQKRVNQLKRELEDLLPPQK